LNKTLSENARLKAEECSNNATSKGQDNTSLLPGQAGVNDDVSTGSLDVGTVAQYRLKPGPIDLMIYENKTRGPAVLCLNTTGQLEADGNGNPGRKHEDPCSDEIQIPHGEREISFQMYTRSGSWKKEKKGTHFWIKTDENNTITGVGHHSAFSDAFFDRALNSKVEPLKSHIGNRTLVDVHMQVYVTLKKEADANVTSTSTKVTKNAGHKKNGVTSSFRTKITYAKISVCWDVWWVHNCTLLKQISNTSNCTAAKATVDQGTKCVIKKSIATDYLLLPPCEDCKVKDLQERKRALKTAIAQQV